MIDTTGLFSIEKMKKEDVDINKAWDDLGYFSRLVSDVGLLQHDIENDPLAGPEYRALTVEAMTYVVQNFAEKDLTPTEEQFGHVAAIVVAQQKLAWKFMFEKLQQASIAMQVIPVQELMVEVRDADLPELSEDLMSRVKKVAGENAGFLAARPHKYLAEIMRAGVDAAGGEEQFAEIQMNVAAGLPDGVKGNMGACLAATITASLATALTQRGSSYQMVAVTTQALINSVSTMRRVMSLPAVCDYALNPHQVHENILAMAVDAVSYIGASPEETIDNLDKIRAEFDAERGVAQELAKDELGPDVKVKETSSIFANNGTMN